MPPSSNALKKIDGCTHKKGGCYAHYYTCKMCCPGCRELAAARAVMASVTGQPVAEPPKKKKNKKRSLSPTRASTRIDREAQQERLLNTLSFQDERFRPDGSGKIDLSLQAMQEMFGWETIPEGTIRAETREQNPKLWNSVVNLLVNVAEQSIKVLIDASHAGARQLMRGDVAARMLGTDNRFNDAMLNQKLLPNLNFFMEKAIVGSVEKRVLAALVHTSITKQDLQHLQQKNNASANDYYKGLVLNRQQTARAMLDAELLSASQHIVVEKRILYRKSKYDTDNSGDDEEKEGAAANEKNNQPMMSAAAKKGRKRAIQNKIKANKIKALASVDWQSQWPTQAKVRGGDEHLIHPVPRKHVVVEAANVDEMKEWLSLYGIPFRHNNDVYPRSVLVSMTKRLVTELNESDSRGLQRKDPPTSSNSANG